MLQPFLVIGVGGSGGKTLRALRHALELRLAQEDWRGGWPQAWQFLHIDSPVHQDGAEFSAPMLPPSDYFGLAQPGGDYIGLHKKIMSGIDPKYAAEIARYLPSPLEVKVDVTIGAGKYRAVGRALVLSRLDDIRKRISRSTDLMTTGDAIAKLNSLGKALGATAAVGTPTPIVLIVSSIAGGSGAGQYMDIAEAVKDANKGTTWINGMYSILYAPDVFESVGNTDVLGANALFAMSESMAGMWSKDFSRSSEAVYQKFGIQIPNLGTDPKIHFGPRFNYVIGRGNSQVTFANQPEVYKAVAASLSTWLTDERVQSGLQSYTVANFDANLGALGLTDRSGLGVVNKDTPPFASLGFGRVTLGRDRFVDYSAERLARSCIDKLMDGHKDYLDERNTNINDQIQQKAHLVFADFKSDLGLGNSNPEQLDVISSVRPNRAALLASVRESFLRGAARGANQDGAMSPNAWNDLLGITYSQLATAEGPFAREDRSLRSTSLQRWTTEQRRQTLTAVSRYSSQMGIQISIELLRKLEAELQTQASIVARKQSEAATYGSKISTVISSNLQAAQGASSLPHNHEVVMTTVARMADCFSWYLESEMLSELGRLLIDYQANFIAPLKNNLISMLSTLEKVTSAANKSETIQNAYLDWPKPLDPSVPPKYNPPQNECLLVDLAEFPNEYLKLMSASVPGSSANTAVDAALDQVIAGSLILDDLEESRSWSFISEDQAWVPISREARRDGNQMPQPAQFTISANPLDYLERAHFWLRRSGQAFNDYLTEDLADYLDPAKHPQVEIFDRQKRFREQFAKAFAMSEPLVDLNPGLLSEIHNTTINNRDTVVSTIPFAVNSAIYSEVSTILQPIWTPTSDSWFNQNAKVQSIDIFSVQKPYQPIVMSSIFGPVGTAWIMAQDDEEKREDFFMWRRSRTLWDSIPASPEKKKAMIRGWYVARTLSQVKETVDSKNQPKIEIWSNQTFNYVSFPYPLVTKEAVGPSDYLGAIFYSLGIALGMCNSQGNLTPIYSYQRLMDLGDIRNPASSEFLRWIQKGRLLDEDQPEPKVDRAGPTGEGVENINARKAKIKEHLGKLSKRFTDEIEALDPRKDEDRLNLTWELRDQVRDAFKELLDAADQVSEEEDDL
jgi:hypothetical protein